MKLRIRNLISMCFLTAALVVYTAFHFQPITKLDPEKGWTIWSELWEIFKHPEELAEPMTAVGVSSFLTFSLLVLTAPFLGNIWRKSRITWWMATIFGGMAAGGFWIMVFMHNSSHELLIGGWCLMAAPILNCLGLLLVGLRAPESRHLTPSSFETKRLNGHRNQKSGEKNQDSPFHSGIL